MVNRKVGFCFFNNPHHIYHAASIAFELSQFENCEVSIFCSTEANESTVKSLARDYFSKNDCFDDSCLNIQFLQPSLFYRITRSIKNRDFPGYKAIFNRHKDKLMECDTLVSPSNEIISFKENAGFESKRYVYTHHGAGDREYGFGEWVGLFDLVFLSGEDLKSRFLEELSTRLGLDDKMKVIGYPKFDLCKAKAPRQLFDNTNPIFLYNPHFEPEFSSCFDWGESLIKFFVQHSDMNLIVAPHLNLAKKQKDALLNQAYGYDNILVDVDRESDALIDMTYTLLADVYIGDVSSQVYEFLSISRPCVFLNSKGFNWMGDPSFACWEFGEVVSDELRLDHALMSAFDRHPEFLERQKKGFAKRFYSDKSSASKLGAQHLVNTLPS